MEAVEGEHVGHQLDLHAKLARADEPVHGIAEPQPGVEVPHSVEGRPSGQQRRRYVPWHRLHARMVAVVALQLPVALFPEVVHVSDRRLQLGPRLQPGRLPRELLGMPEVVAVDEGDQLAARLAQAQVSCRRRAAGLLGDDADLFFNLGYAYWLDRDTPAAISWLREAVRRNPADHGAHYVMGVALQAAGSAPEAAREKELARQLSSEYAEWEAKQPGANVAPRGLERVKTDLDVLASLRVENVIVAAGQRDQRELAAFHLEAGRRAYQEERDVEAIAELRRAVYLSPYDSEAHLLLARAYLRGGRVSEALDALKISIWSTDTIAARLVLVEAYIQARDLDTARAQLQTIIKMDPGNPGAQRLLEREGLAR